MSKKKNTLQDLDDFLKQQAATLVTPDGLNNSAIATDASQVSGRSPDVLSLPQTTDFTLTQSSDDPAFRKGLYDFIIASLEKQKDPLPEDKILINTALYLKNGDNWKDAIREYWRVH